MACVLLLMVDVKTLVLMDQDFATCHLARIVFNQPKVNISNNIALPKTLYVSSEYCFSCWTKWNSWYSIFICGRLQIIIECVEYIECYVGLYFSNPTIWSCVVCYGVICARQLAFWVFILPHAVCYPSLHVHFLCSKQSLTVLSILLLYFQRQNQKKIRANLFRLAEIYNGYTRKDNPTDGISKDGKNINISLTFKSEGDLSRFQSKLIELMSICTSY